MDFPVVPELFIQTDPRGWLDPQIRVHMHVVAFNRTRRRGNNAVALLCEASH